MKDEIHSHYLNPAYPCCVACVQVVITAMNDMNLPKLTSDDSPLFAGIVSDLFPGVETPPLDYGRLYEVIRHQLTDNHLQVGRPRATDRTGTADQAGFGDKFLPVYRTLLFAS